LSIQRSQNILIHIGGSVLFLFFALLASPDWPDVGRMLSHPMGRADVIFQFELLAFFYLNYYFLYEKFYAKKQYFIYAVLLLAFVILFVPVMENIVRGNSHDFGERPRHGPHGPHPTFISNFLFNRKIYLFFLVVLGTIFLKTRNRLKAIEKEKTVTELSFLKAQINPHFLFNTLNSIYALAIQKSDATPGAVVKLSGMMRHVLQEAQQNYVSLESEINYVKDFIDLQKLRLDEKVKLSFNVSGELHAKKIAPLILMSFIENAFKYGVNSEQDSLIAISIRVDENILLLNVKNNKVRTTLASTSNTRLGLINTKKRLDLLYPGYLLDIQDKDSEFLVNLKIQLHD
jgi:hypothetical protein